GKPHRWQEEQGCTSAGSPAYVRRVDLLCGALQFVAEPGNQRSKDQKRDHIKEENVLHAVVEVRRADHRRRMMRAEPAVGHVNNRYIEEGEDRQRRSKNGSRAGG